MPDPGRNSAPRIALLAAPHRPMFLSGGVLLLIGFVIWVFELASRAGVGAAVTGPIPAGWLHALVVSSGVFPFFMFGFLLTAMPRWQGTGDLSMASWTGAWWLMVAGWAVVVLGLWLPGLFAIGLVLVLLGWSMIGRVLWRIAHAPREDRMHARVVAWAILAGALALIVWLVGVLTGDATWARIAINLSFWWSLLPIFVAVCHRMIPFFSANIIDAYVMVRPRWALAVLIAASLSHGALAILGYAQLTWIVDAPAAAVALWLSWHWRLGPAQKVPLLGMLHIGFAWLGIGLLLCAVEALLATVGSFGLGLGPVHAIGIGFFGSILLAMVSRVTLGHSGRPLEADRLTRSLFLALQAVVCMRIAADLVPWTFSATLMLIAGAAWLAVFGAWSMHYLPIYWRPRVDGKAG